MATLGEVAWLRKRLAAMTAGPLRVNDSDAPNYWLEQIHGRFVVADFRENEVHDPQANAIGFGVLRNLAPSMLAVIEAAEDDKALTVCWDPRERITNTDGHLDEEPCGLCGPCALGEALDAFHAAVREEEDR